MMVGNGKHLNITHTGSLNLPSPSKTFTLSNVFCVLDMKQNLISVSKFCKSNNVSVEFSPSLFIVKDLRTGAPLLQGKNKNGVYEWPSSPSRVHQPPLFAFSCVRASLPNWHSRLGHPSTKILRHVISSFNLPVPSSKSLIFFL